MNITQADRLNSVSTYYFAKKLAEIDQMNKINDIQVINLGIGSPDLPPPPSVIDTLRSSALLADVNKYQSYRGIPQLRKAFSTWYQRHFNINIDAEKEILPLIGSKEGIMHIHMGIINPGDIVLVPDPGYPAYAVTAKLAGATVLKYNLLKENNWLPDFHELEKMDLKNVKIMWLNYPHMPTGAKANLAFYKKIVAFGLRHNIIIAHDNPYAFILNDKPISIFEVKGSKDCCLELVSLSKCYNMSGWRIGALIANKQLINVVLKFKSNMDSGMYKPLQLAAIKALEMDQSWTDQLNEKYNKRRVVARTIMTHLDCQYQENSAGLFVWGKVNTSINNTLQYCDTILQNSKVFITPGEVFGKNGKRYIRMSLCNTVQVLNEALERIKKMKR
ncbi:MAG: aminotransferase class I/II-fold pyridoxal phosphate-dependent enzyme [Saprospiraceae bacterium]